jgi:hypothetical protein
MRDGKDPVDTVRVVTISVGLISGEQASPFIHHLSLHVDALEETLPNFITFCSIFYSCSFYILPVM